MTFSIIARCPRTGRLGIGIASYSIAIGLYCDGCARANTGITITQAFPNPVNNRLALRLLAQGLTARHALSELLANDPDQEYRQIVIIDREGDVAAHSGPKARLWSGHRTGACYVALGDMLAGRGVVDALAERFEASPQEELEDRLLEALEGGRDAGGHIGSSGRLPERSAAIIVQGGREYSDFDLRVDLHDEPIAELKRIYVDYKPHAAYYVERARNPRKAIPSMEFADMLKKSRQGGEHS